MRNRLAVAATVVVCVLAGANTAAADNAPTRIVGADGHVLKRHQAFVRAALVPAPPGRVMVRFSGCPRFPRFTGCVQMWRPRTIYLQRRLADERMVFLHELGHVFDKTVMLDADRAEFKRIQGRAARVLWWVGANSPREWFADAYALCARKRSISRRPAASDSGYAPTPARHAASCRLIEAAAAAAAAR